MISNLGFGGATLTNLSSLSEIMRLLDAAYDYGIRHFDTAPLYGQGYSEVIYGKFLKNKRTNVTLTTKFGLGDYYNTERLSVHVILPLNSIFKAVKNRMKAPAKIVEEPFAGLTIRKIDKTLIENSFQKSLRRLKTDYIDYYFLHEGLPSFLTDEAFAYLQDLKKSGQVRSLGVGSNVFGIRSEKASDLAGWDVLQYESHVPKIAEEVMSRFHDQRHFHHSIMRRLHEAALLHIVPEHRGGFLLSEAAKKNPSGKVIFSTRSMSSLKSNIESFVKFNAE